MPGINPEFFSFEGFEPTQEIRSLAKDMMWKVEGRAPSKASRMASLTKQGDTYSGHMKISSVSGVFESESSGQDPKQVIETLSRDIHEKLNAWKRSRFDV